MARSIATVSGTAIVPGVSRNGRLYTREIIAKAVKRAQKRLAEDGMDIADLTDRVGDPLSQRTHHAADDDSTRIVGRLRSITLDEATGAAKYTADLADTTRGRDILALIDTSDGHPAFLRGVSIRGAWIGPVQNRLYEGRTVETADDLELDGLDYTGKPGVPAARVEKVEPTKSSHPKETATERVAIYESVQEAVVQSTPETVSDAAGADTPPPAGGDEQPVGGTATVQEKGAPALKSGKPAAAPTKASKYADPGYQDDKAPRYALDTRDQAKSAWSYISQAKNAKNYTPNQLKRVKERIVKALKGFGVQVDTKERWLISPAIEVTEAVAEYFDMEPPYKSGSFYVTLSNGPVSVSVSSGCIDPADLDLIGRAAMDGACKALAGLDPDMDGDIDVPGAGSEDTDKDTGTARETAPETPYMIGPAGHHGNDGLAVLKTAPPGTTSETTASHTPAPTPAAATTIEEETVVTDAPTTPAAGEQPATPAPAAAPGVTLSAEQFQQLLNAATAPRPPETVLVGAGAAVEAAPPVAQPATETSTTAPAATTAPAGAVVESDDDRIARIVEERMKVERLRIVQEVVAQTGPPARKGLQRPVAENSAGLSAPAGPPEGWPQKAFDKYTEAERDQFFGGALVEYVTGGRVTAEQ